jgi:anti-sigma factor RsiW
MFRLTFAATPALALHRHPGPNAGSNPPVPTRLGRTAAASLAVTLFALGGWSLHAAFGDRPAVPVHQSADPFGTQAAAVHVVLKEAGPLALQVVSLDRLSQDISKALGVAVKLRDPRASGYRLVSAWVLPALRGKAVQLAFLDTSTAKVVTMYFEGRPDTANSPFRAVPDAPVPTVAWQDDGLACAVSGIADPEQLEQAGRRIYDALLS